VRSCALRPVQKLLLLLYLLPFLSLLQEEEEGGRSMEDGGGAAEPLQEARAALPAKRRFGAVGPPAS
jgi:hypothetical protein